MTTYWSGIVNDHDTNGILMQDHNKLSMKGQYEAYELCDLIHLEKAESLAVYRDDFYAGRPALTVNTFGEVKAYYIATKIQEEFYTDFYEKLINEAGLTRILMNTELPKGVTAQVRTDGVNQFMFILNFSDQEQMIDLDKQHYTDMETGLMVKGELSLPLYGVRILKR